MFVDRPEGKRVFGRPRHMWGENIKMDIQDMGWAGMDWSDQAQERDRRQVFVNAVVNHWGP